jgi:hypothetical protein
LSRKDFAAVGPDQDGALTKDDCLAIADADSSLPTSIPVRPLFPDL